MSIFSYYIYLARQGKSYSISNFTKLLNFFICSWFLMAEIVCRKAYDNQLIFMFLIQFLETFVLRRVPTLARSIYHENFLSFKLREVYYSSSN